LLGPFMEGMRSAGAEISLYYASKMDVHACALQRPELAESAQEILDLVKQCGRDLVSQGEMNPALLEKISRPLIPWE
jgi:hypothetical protein